MKNRLVAPAVVLAVALMVVAVTPVTLAGQRAETRPQTPGVPRTPDGQPDIQGFWGAEGVDAYDIEFGFSPISLKILDRDARQFKSVVAGITAADPVQHIAARLDERSLLDHPVQTLIVGSDRPRCRLSRYRQSATHDRADT